MPGRARLLYVAVSLIALAASAAHAQSSASAVDWSQPPVACVEDIVPAKPDRPCPDLSTVADPTKEFPAHMSAAEVEYWKSSRRYIRYCRAQEILAREAKAPGSYKPVIVQAFWMSHIAVANTAEKVASIYEASRIHKIPAQVLTGALYQESLLAELGITEDGSNYSCGIGQINLQEWCHWANKQSSEKRKKMGWPNGVSCKHLSRTLVKPYYEIAVTRLGGLPKYRLTADHFKGIELKSVRSAWPGFDENTRVLNHKAVRSFIQSCQNPRDSIAAKANELALLYSMHVSKTALRASDFYQGKNKYQRKCREEGHTSAYPLNTGWLLAVGMYNYGPDALDVVANYNEWSTRDLGDPRAIGRLDVRSMVEAVYWSGRWDPKAERLLMFTPSGKPKRTTWKKQCVLYNHIAGIVRHVTIPGQGPILPEFPYEACPEAGVPEKRAGGTGTKFVPAAAR